MTSSSTPQTDRVRSSDAAGPAAGACWRVCPGAYGIAQRRQLAALVARDACVLRRGGGRARVFPPCRALGWQQPASRTGRTGTRVTNRTQFRVSSPWRISTVEHHLSEGHVSIFGARGRDAPIGRCLITSLIPRWPMADGGCAPPAPAALRSEVDGRSVPGLRSRRPQFAKPRPHRTSDPARLWRCPRARARGRGDRPSDHGIR